MPTSVQLIDSQISLESKTLFEAIIKKSGPLVTKSIRTDPSLLNKFCDFDSTHGFKTPLLVAVELGFLPIIRLLYQLNADVSICTSITKQSVIHAAARTGQVQAIRFLIDHYHADAKHFIFEKDAKGQTPLLVAASSRSTDSGTCADIFLKLGANIADECPVLNGWSHQDSKIANKIPRLKKDQGKTEFVDALYLAQESKNDDAIRAILKRMKSVNIETVGAIIAHSPKNKNEKFKAIYSQLENPNKMADSKGRNLLMLALEKGKTEIGKFLLQQNISIHSVDNSGNTVLSYCACSSIASTLLMSGLRWDTPLNNAGQTPLEILEERGEDFQDVVELIALAKSVADGDSILEDNDDIASVLNQVMTNESLEETNITLQAHLEALQAQLSVLHPALIEESADLIGDLMKEIIGMDKLKNDLRSWLRTQQVDKARRRQGIHIGEPHMPHTVLLGNPGTGKTTVARIIAKALSKIGITNNKFAELTRDQLVGGYIGQTEKQMQELFKTYAGGVLFIDEAYRLVGGGVDYGRIALESMMTQMTTKNNDIVFIFAGYPNEMKAFMNVNPGLSRRIDQTFNFEDYSPEELTKIVEVTGISRGFKFEPEAIAKLPHLIFYGFDPSVRAKFNGGLADRLFTLAKEQIDLRTMDENLNNVDTLMTITEPDVRNAIPRLVDLISGNDDGVFEGPVREITGIDEFNKVILTPGIVVDFYADWCGPSKMIKPIYAKLAKLYPNLLFARVDADNVPETKQMAAINAYPTFQWFKNGKKIQELVGADVKKLKSFTERCSKSMADSQNPLSDESPVANSVVKAPERTVEEPLVEEEKIIEVFDVEQFDNLVASEDTLVVDFHAVWCQSCKAATPEFEKLSKKFTNLKFAKVDADDTNIAKIKKVNDFPYFKFYKAGQIKGELLVEHDVEDFAKLRQMTERFDLEETPVAVPSCSIKRPDEPQISTASETKVAAPPPKTVTKQESAETEEKKGEEEEEEEGGDDSGESDENKALYSKLKQISNCPAGYVWNRCEGGYRCAGGSHFVTNEELDKFFTV